MAFTGYKNGKMYIDDEHIEAVGMSKQDSVWVIDVFLRYPNGSRGAYPIYRHPDEATVKKRLDPFLAQHEVTLIE